MYAPTDCTTAGPLGAELGAEDGADGAVDEAAAGLSGVPLLNKLMKDPSCLTPLPPQVPVMSPPQAKLHCASGAWSIGIVFPHLITKLVKPTTIERSTFLPAFHSILCTSILVLLGSAGCNTFIDSIVSG